MTQFFRLIAIDHDAIERERLACRPARKDRPVEEDLGILLRVIGMDIRQPALEPSFLSVPDYFNVSQTVHYNYRCLTESGRTLNVLDTEVQAVSLDYVRYYMQLSPELVADPRD